MRTGSLLPVPLISFIISSNEQVAQLGDYLVPAMKNFARYDNK